MGLNLCFAQSLVCICAWVLQIQLQRKKKKNNKQQTNKQKVQNNKPLASVAWVRHMAHIWTLNPWKVQFLGLASEELQNAWTFLDHQMRVSNQCLMRSGRSKSKSRREIPRHKLSSQLVEIFVVKMIFNRVYVKACQFSGGLRLMKRIQMHWETGSWNNVGRGLHMISGGRRALRLRQRRRKALHGRQPSLNVCQLCLQIYYLQPQTTCTSIMVYASIKVTYTPVKWFGEKRIGSKETASVN